MKRAEKSFRDKEMIMVRVPSGKNKKLLTDE